MTTIGKVIATHRELCDEARSIIEKKGHDYNRERQNGGDTLYNIVVCKELGIVDSVTQGLLVRLSDKMMRLISLTKDPSIQAQVTDESVRDTIKDTINYLTYLYIKWDEVAHADPPLYKKPRSEFAGWEV